MFTKKEKLAILFGLLTTPVAPSDLEPEIRELIGLPKNLPGGGYGIDDVIYNVREALAELLG